MREHIAHARPMASETRPGLHEKLLVIFACDVALWLVVAVIWRLAH